MAADLWNRVNIPRPGAVCAVRVPFTDITDARLRRVLDKNSVVLSLLRSELLQTDIRVLYELLYVLNNSFRANQTLRGLKRVEQCINKLKNMKLDEALQEVQDYFPKNIQRKLSIEAGEGDVPSQPLLEWLCLKVLGGAQLMSCTMQHCRTTFTLSRQHLMWGEFIVLNTVVTSMLSRLWVIFRGMLVSLSVLYQHLLPLVREVSSAQPMTFLTDFSLPKDVMQFLCLSDSFLLTKLEECVRHDKPMEQEIRERKKKNLTSRNKKTKKNRVDLGVAIQRGAACHTNWKASQKVAQVSTKVSKAKPALHQKYISRRKNVYKEELKKVATFTEMVTRLDTIITWCQKHQMTKQEHFLRKLHHQCLKLKKLEGGGHNLCTKLKSFKLQACSVFYRNWIPPKSRCPSAPREENTHRRTRSLKYQLRKHLKKPDRMWMKLKRQRKGTKESRKSNKRSKETTEPSARFKKTSKVMTEPSTGSNKRSKVKTKRSKVKTKTSTRYNHSDDHDDIDNIFASAGL